MFKLLSDVKNVTIGGDPEVFLGVDGVVIPACGLIGGTKEEPVRVPFGALQEDNIMAEFNIDPTSDVEEFIHNTMSVLNTLNLRARDHALELVIQASAEVDPFLLDMYPQARLFGCDPDFNAYTLKVNPTPNVESNVRTCAGHIHLGFDHETDDRFSMGGYVVKYLDVVVGLWTVLQDKDQVRRTRYGKAGAFRPKPYGVEYRVPSNFWLKDTGLMAEVFSRTKTAYSLAQQGVELPEADEVVTAINTHNEDACLSLLKEVA